MPFCCRQESIAQRLAEDFAKDLKELQDISGSSSGIYHMLPLSGTSLGNQRFREEVTFA